MPSELEALPEGGGIHDERVQDIGRAGLGWDRVVVGALLLVPVPHPVRHLHASPRIGEDTPELVGAVLPFVTVGLSVDRLTDQVRLDGDPFVIAEGFEDWCADYGYDTDSRKALELYEQCQRIGKQVHRLLGSDFTLFQNAEH